MSCRFEKVLHAERNASNDAAATRQREHFKCEVEPGSRCDFYRVKKGFMAESRACPCGMVA